MGRIQSAECRMLNSECRKRLDRSRSRSKPCLYIEAAVCGGDVVGQQLAATHVQAPEHDSRASAFCILHSAFRSPTLRAVAAALCCLVTVPPADAGTVTGVIRTVVRKGTPAATAVVYADPIQSAAQKSPQRVMLRQRNKTFLPRVLAVQAGSTVEFPNDDDIFHNVFS